MSRAPRTRGGQWLARHEARQADERRIDIERRSRERAGETNMPTTEHQALQSLPTELRRLADVSAVTSAQAGYYTLCADKLEAMLAAAPEAPLPADRAAMRDEARSKLVEATNAAFSYAKHGDQRFFDAFKKASKSVRDAIDALALAPSASRERMPKGWFLDHVQEVEPGIVEIGHCNEEGTFAEIVIVDTANYYQPQDAMPIARAIVAALSAAQAAQPGER